MTTFSSQRQSPEVAQVEQRLLDIFNILGKNNILVNLSLLCCDLEEITMNIKISYDFKRSCLLGQK